jgi:hypothetical protein
MPQNFPKKFFRGPDGKLLPLTPEEQAALDQRAKEESTKRFTPVDRIGQAILMGIPDFLQGLFTGSGEDMGATPRVAGELVAAATPFGALKAGGLKGMFSRVDKAVGAMPSQFHPNKAKSALSSMASKEELDYRKVPEFLNSFGNKTVKKEEFIDYLMRNQEPQLKVTQKGKPYDPDADEDLALIRSRGFDVGEDEFGASELIVPDDVDINDLGNYQITPEVAAAFGRVKTQSDRPKFQQYTLPGGENYRETLIQLEHAPKAQKRLQQLESEWLIAKQYGDTAAIDRLDLERGDLFNQVNKPQYHSAHWDEPNILVHTRHNDRRLPGEMPKDALSDADPRDFGPKGRFLEEVQSDWHQAGRDKGYARQASQEEIDAARNLLGQRTSELSHLEAQLMEEFGVPRRNMLSWDETQLFDPQIGDTFKLGDTQIEVVGRSGVNVDVRYPDGNVRTTTRPGLSNILDSYGAHPRPAWLDDPRLRQLEDLGLRRMEAENALHAVESPEGVPDAPFKDSWPDLALKQQINEVAESPDLEWLGFTAGKTQTDRYNLSNHINRIEWMPDNAAGDGRGTFGAWDRTGDHLMSESGIMPERVEELIGREAAQRLWSATPDPTGRAALFTNDLDVEVGGEGMRYFYDQLLPKRLEKILAPFGGKVQKETLLPRTTTDKLVPGERESVQEVQAWIARLTPEMKAEIKKRGLPLMLMLMASPEARAQFEQSFGTKQAITNPPGGF